VFLSSPPISWPVWAPCCRKRSFSPFWHLSPDPCAVTFFFFFWLFTENSSLPPLPFPPQGYVPPRQGNSGYFPFPPTFLIFSPPLFLSDIPRAFLPQPSLDPSIREDLSFFPFFSLRPTPKTFPAPFFFPSWSPGLSLTLSHSPCFFSLGPLFHFQLQHLFSPGVLRFQNLSDPRADFVFPNFSYGFSFSFVHAGKAGGLFIYFFLWPCQHFSLFPTLSFLRLSPSELIVYFSTQHFLQLFPVSLSGSHPLPHRSPPAT